ncbi:NAD(P)(+)--arginine ADP-ribosyltransferase 2-like [Scyliorhinus canicula]|uniref:NAD(P)(+)--arginine ADP-ribosyltransferase 2-like n=1 Tax=Scyliorhinus canicula TaxID=7830 RepID=UPI0018F78FDF|nr:NAD(P)(+)--arginine ADP-ribosyltransferase 2-like [Scyliorhinus canicula]XP_038654758.1 NAD(P)(+)--arginine ADP-ribosyltransferase 2-like [Scyliorhinus canicula]XP_038654759.1 NAD(P)(+)--arginine ADP-ribosyltransferase 2-like [Scyliorhinus canicula]
MLSLLYFLLLALRLDTRSTLAVEYGRNVINLNMAKDSAAYIFTQSLDADQAAIDYIRKEWANRGQYLNVWLEANQSLGNCGVPDGLRREHLVAIRAYTQDSALYLDFNTATRQFGTNYTIYRDNFYFKAFHYLLSVALDHLKEKSHSTYRGVDILFNASKGQNVRLGQFPSTTMKSKKAKQFMKPNRNNTLFKIKTKLGVRIRNFSYFPDEEEVLIPPIEVFNVKKVPKWKKNGSKRWLQINLVSSGRVGITVLVKTCNGTFEVNRANGKCPNYCQCFHR